jgi:SHS2 domain-containing protein
MKYKFLKDVAISEIAFQAFGTSLEKTIANAGIALAEIMANTKKIPLKLQKEFSVEGNDNESLLYNFLEELVYMKDVEGLIFKKFKIKIREKKLEAKCFGAKLEDIGKNNLKNDVKAITMYMFSLKKKGKNWVATIVVDI